MRKILLFNMAFLKVEYIKIILTFSFEGNKISSKVPVRKIRLNRIPVRLEVTIFFEKVTGYS